MVWEKEGTCHACIIKGTLRFECDLEENHEGMHESKLEWD